MERQRVLFACTHNSARSQMAEGMLRAWADDRFEASSAGAEATGVKPEAIQVMSEIGIDISGQHSKTIAQLHGQSFDWFITVCDDGQESCPVLPGVANVAHWNLRDPSAARGSADERLAVFRQVRDAIDHRLRQFILAAGGEALPAEVPTERR